MKDHDKRPLEPQDRGKRKAGAGARRIRRIPSLAALTACSLLFAASLRADTIYLKDGSFIDDCKVTKETATDVHVRTKVGDMVVPRDKIYRVLKQKTVYDMYEEQRARIRDDDANGLYKLAAWCRTREGLRKEADELLEKVIALNGNHAGARVLLGHVRVDKEWVVPPPLSLCFQVANPASQDAQLLGKRLALFVETRKDVRLVSKLDSIAPVDGCTLDASIGLSRTTGSHLYGVPMGTPALAASIRLRAQSTWIGKRVLNVSLDGQVPATGGEKATSQAIQNALGMNSQKLHQYLDQIVQLRSKVLEVELKKAAKERQEKE